MPTNDTHTEQPSAAPPGRHPYNSPLYRLVEARIPREDGTPMEYIRRRRAATPPTPFYRITEELYVKTGIRVTHETCRRWLISAENPQQ